MYGNANHPTFDADGKYRTLRSTQTASGRWTRSIISTKLVASSSPIESYLFAAVLHAGLPAILSPKSFTPALLSPWSSPHRPWWVPRLDLAPTLPAMEAVVPRSSPPPRQPWRHLAVPGPRPRLADHGGPRAWSSSSASSRA